ncbi:MAG: hypothetical protein N2595_00970 [bacterium]|nr:hypothetical protein [bacterium]
MYAERCALDIRNSFFLHNYATFHTGAPYLHLPPSAVISNTVFQWNVAGHAGALPIFSDRDVYLRDSLLASNVAVEPLGIVGGALIENYSQSFLDNLTILHNVSSGYFGGLSVIGTATYHRLTVRHNRVRLHVGGFLLSSDHGLVADSLIEDNLVRSTNALAGVAGGLYCAGNIQLLSLVSPFTIRRNQAALSGGIYLDPFSTIRLVATKPALPSSSTTIPPTPVARSSPIAQI